MTYIESNNLTSISLFDTCKICSKTRKEIILEQPTRKHGAYYLDKFSNHLKSHQIPFKDYYKLYIAAWPLCPVSREEVGYRFTGKGLVFSTFKRGKINKQHCPAFKEACQKLSKARIGKNNPMYGKIPWNFNLDRSHPSINRIALLREGSRASLATRQKQSISAQKRKIHGHTGKKHSQESKEKMKLATAKLWMMGKFNRISSIHVKMRDFLKTLRLKENFIEEFQVAYYSMDFAFPNAKVAIECQGTFFHVDARIYPNGPINAIQRRNFGRDKAKQNFCSKIGWKIIPIWETEINDGTFKNIILCKLSELNLLNQ